MEEAHQIAAEKAGQCAARGRDRYNEKDRSSDLQPGDRVLIRNFAERGGPLTPPQSRCSYSILHLKLFNIFTKNVTKRSSETAKLHQENGGQYGYRHIKAQKYFQSWVSNHCI